MTTCCKFVLTDIIQSSYNPENRKFIFEARYDQSIPEDQRFFKATPSGKFEMLVDNPQVIAELKCGKAYYLNISEVPSAIRTTV